MCDTKCEFACVRVYVCEGEWKGREAACVLVQDWSCVYFCCTQYFVCMCVGLLYTTLGAKTLEIALIWILFVSSNHNHVTNSPRQQRLIHGAERRPSCMLLLYIHFILQELCPQNGSIHLQEPHNGDGQKNFTTAVRDATPSQIYLGGGHCCEALHLRNGGKTRWREGWAGNGSPRWEAAIAERGATTWEVENQPDACCSRAKWDQEVKLCWWNNVCWETEALCTLLKKQPRKIQSLSPTSEPRQTFNCFATLGHKQNGGK